MSYALAARQSRSGLSEGASVSTPFPASRRSSSSMAIGNPQSTYEQEADRVANHMTRGGSKLAWSISRMNISATEDAPVRAAAALPHVLGSHSEPLDRGARAFFEPRFGHNFSAIRIHADAHAASSARSMDASAYTTGNHMVFGAGQYAPMSGAGRALLAHELTHVVQQQGAGAALVQRQPVAGGAPSAPAAKPPAGPPAKETPDMLDKDLRNLIADSDWGVLRNTLYNKQSAPGVTHAKERKAGKRPDLTGLGKIAGLDSYAVAIRGIQTQWAKDKTATPVNRVQWIGKAANDALTAASVPKLKGADPEDMRPRGALVPLHWKLLVQEKLVNEPTLPDSSAADLANVTLHECRHAEQQYAAARYAAGVDGMNAAQIATQQDLEPTIAADAVAHKMDTSTNPAEKALGASMHQSMGVNAAKNQATTSATTDELKVLDSTLTEAKDAATALEAKATPATMNKAQAERRALKNEVAKVARRYGAYRAIPHEADAHEVGDAEEQSFKGWQP